MQLGSQDEICNTMGSGTLICTQLEGTPLRIRMDGQARVKPNERIKSALTLRALRCSIIPPSCVCDQRNN